MKWFMLGIGIVASQLTEARVTVSYEDIEKAEALQKAQQMVPKESEPPRDRTPARRAMYEVDIEKKLQSCKELVDKAIVFFASHRIDESCRAFSQDPVWRRGEIQVFVFDAGGVCYVFGHQKDVIWKDFQEETTALEEAFIPSMLETGKQGGMVSYRWNNAFMESYVRTIERHGKTFIIGAGFFPTSAEYHTEQLVKAAVKYGQTHPAKQLFENISNPLGMFILGDIYLYAYDFEGNVVAHGESFELIGQNMIDAKTEDGKYRTRDIIAIAKADPGYGWYSYASRQGGIEKRSYIERYVDPKTGKRYAIVGGYYPTITDETVQGVVKRAAAYLRAQGAERAFPEFSKKTGDFAVGSVRLFVYDSEGTMVADMANPAFVGLNLINTRDTEGKYITRTILSQSQRYPNGSWIGFSLRNSYALMYVERISVPDGDFILGASYYPTSKYIQVRFTVDKAVAHMQAHEKEQSLRIFSSDDPDFLRGDISVFVYDTFGTIWVDGPFHERIWHYNGDIRDDKGIPVSEKIIAIATSGGGWFEFPKNNATLRVYVKQVEKQTGVKGRVDTFIVGSGYYL